MAISRPEYTLYVSTDQGVQVFKDYKKFFIKDGFLEVLNHEDRADNVVVIGIPTSAINAYSVELHWVDHERVDTTPI